MDGIIIRETFDADLQEILRVEEEAFGSKEEAQLTSDLLGDPTAQPLLSLMALDDSKPVGHILFTKSVIAGFTEPPDSYILAPLAVTPAYQNSGIGSKLVLEGVKILKERGAGLIFVLGHKKYYPKFGFIPDAGALGLPAPYTIPEKDADAWMVLGLKSELIGQIKGKVQCAQAMDKPEYWRE